MTIYPYLPQAPVTMTSLALHELADGGVVAVNAPQLLLGHHLEDAQAADVLAASMRSLLGNALLKVSTMSAFSCASSNWR